MTDEIMSLGALLSSDTDLLRKMIGFTAEPPALAA
jgi:hypothetical protein